MPKAILPWAEKVAMLKRYRDMEGDCNVPQHYCCPETGFRMGRWVANMRQRSDFISSQQYKDLDDLGFVWTRYKIIPWAAKMELLAKYKRIHGDLLVSKDYVDPDTKVRLGGLVDRLRQSKDTLNIARKQELESMGFVWNAYNNHWDTMFELLEQYGRERGHIMPRASEFYKDLPLGQWVAVQRNAYSKRKRGTPGNTGTMSDDRIERLDSIGFSWVLRSTMDEYHEAIHDAGGEDAAESSSDPRPPTSASAPVKDEVAVKGEKRPKEEPTEIDEATMPPAKQPRTEGMDFIQRVSAI